MTTPEGPNTPDQTPAEASTTEVKKSRTGLWVGIGIAVLVVIAVVIAAVSGAFGGKSGAESPSPSASVSASPSASPSETPSATPDPSPSAPASAALPADCTAVYSPAFLAEYAERNPLNDATNSLEGSTDEKTLALIKAVSDKQLRCTLGGAGESGASTVVSQVTPEQQAAVLAVLAERGATCGTELNGTLCQIVTLHAEGIDRTWETSYFRDGLWIQTEQVQFLDKRDFITDIVHTVFGS